MQKRYNLDDLAGMMQESEISGDEMQGDYFAICDNGTAYNASYVNDYLPGGVMFFCIPAGLKILGYIPVTV